jgi:CRISPR/Cas system endoribonuclease Cas6 (RAMP superfamily)
MNKQTESVENAKAKYEMIRSELEKETREFDLLKRQHERRLNQLADDATKAWAEYHSARIDAKLAQKHAASAIDFIKTAMEGQR